MGLRKVRKVSIIKKQSPSAQPRELVSAQSSKGYWRPDLTQAGWNLLNYRMDREIQEPTNFIDKDTKWLLANEKGVKVFVIYGIGDGTQPTILFAVGGNYARPISATTANVKEGMESGAYQDARSYNRWARDLWSQFTNSLGDSAYNSQQGPGISNDTVPDVNSGESSERTGNLDQGRGDRRIDERTTGRSTSGGTQNDRGGISGTDGEVTYNRSDPTQESRSVSDLQKGYTDKNIHQKKKPAAFGSGQAKLPLVGFFEVDALSVMGGGDGAFCALGVVRAEGDLAAGLGTLGQGAHVSLFGLNICNVLAGTDIHSGDLCFSLRGIVDRFGLRGFVFHRHNFMHSLFFLLQRAAPGERYAPSILFILYYIL